MKFVANTVCRHDLRNWLAMSVYSSSYRVSPQTRGTNYACVNLYDEASKSISAVTVDYVVTQCTNDQFFSVNISPLLLKSNELMVF